MQLDITIYRQMCITLKLTFPYMQTKLQSFGQYPHQFALSCIRLHCLKTLYCQAITVTVVMWPTLGPCVHACRRVTAMFSQASPASFSTRDVPLDSACAKRREGNRNQPSTALHHVRKTYRLLLLSLLLQLSFLVISHFT